MKRESCRKEQARYVHAPQSYSPVPEETARVGHAAFPKGNRYLQMRDVLGTIYTDELFADLYPQKGQPWRQRWRHGV